MSINTTLAGIKAETRQLEMLLMFERLKGLIV